MKKINIPEEWEDVPDAVRSTTLRDDITWIRFTAACVESDYEVSLLKPMKDVKEEFDGEDLNEESESEEE